MKKKCLLKVIECGMVFFSVYKLDTQKFVTHIEFTNKIIYFIYYLLIA